MIATSGILSFIAGLLLWIGANVAAIKHELRDRSPK